METREAWLNDLTRMLRPRFVQAGAPLPERVRIAIGFTSHGKKGRRIGECWDSAASADAHFEIYIRPDLADPIDVGAVLVHELTHAAAGIAAKHGPAFRRVAQAVGLTGAMRATVASPALREHLTECAAQIGVLPHASLGLGLGHSTAPPKQTTRMHKCKCGACGYTCRVSMKWIGEAGAPVCPTCSLRLATEER